MSHTKEPWHTTYEDVGEWTVREDSNNELLADIYSDEKGYMENQKANAKRIVVCVNACAGITNEALEAGVVACGVNNLRDNIPEGNDQFYFDNIKVFEEDV